MQQLWKWLGLVALAGLVAGGLGIVQRRRAKARLSPDLVRARLHERADQAERDGQDPGSELVDGPGNPGSTESSARA